VTGFLHERARRNGERFRRTVRAVSGFLTVWYWGPTAYALYMGETAVFGFALGLALFLWLSPFNRHVSWFTAWAGYRVNGTLEPLELEVLECGHCGHVTYDLDPFAGPAGSFRVMRGEETLRWYCDEECLFEGEDL
jgi:hypothetical protein